MSPLFYECVIVGFLAQLVDGALGMAYGITASSLLMTIGIPPAITSATVHVSECFTTGASGLSHHTFGNIDKALFRRLIVPGIFGAVLGAYILSNLPGDEIKPFISAYLLIMGCFIIFKGLRSFPSRQVTTYIRPLAFCGAFIDAIGGGGWGPVVATTLLVRGNQIRETIGSVNAAEFFITLAASLTFLFTVGWSHWDLILGLALGGLIAAPIGAWACKRLPIKPFMVAVGVLVIVLSLRNIFKYFEVL